MAEKGLQLLGRAAPRSELFEPPGLFPLKGCKILVIESNPDYRALLSDWLQGAGAQIETAESLVTAQQVLNRKPPTLILSALQLMDGNTCDLIRNLRQSELLEAELGQETRRIPTVSLTPLARECNCCNLRAGFDVQISRPKDANPLIHILMETMARCVR